MSHPSRPQPRGPAQRRRRDHQIEPIQNLEDRCLLAPVVTVLPPQATFTPAANPTNANLGMVTIAPSTTATAYPTAAPVTSVSELTPISSFGGDIVRIKAGPGGDFGKGIYAISRGAGDNAAIGAVDRPGVIYRVDPATGKASVFFDLNTVIGQLPTASVPPDASNITGDRDPETGELLSGLVNWYDLAFDPEGYFDGHPSLFVASVDRSDPNKNVIYRIGPDGSFLGAFVQFTQGLTQLKFNVNPTSILVPPPEDQSFLRGLIAGCGVSSTGGQFTALFFNANGYSPGQIISTGNLPAGVSLTGLNKGPQVGLTAANADYLSRVYSAFTDFGTPAGGGIPARPGASGVQGLNGEFLIAPPTTTTNTTGAPITPLFSGIAGSAAPVPLEADQQPLVDTTFRRFEDIAFDQYGYFSQGFNLTATTTGTTTTVPTPLFAGSLFVADLATGLSVQVTPQATTEDETPTPINIPIQGEGTVGVIEDVPNHFVPLVTNGNTTGGTNIGGRIIRITPSGVVTTFAQGFHTSGNQDASSFQNSSLSLTFSADGTTLYASDDDGIWQFKTTTSLASSTSGSIVGLNDLRTLGVPYEGQDSAVAIVDTGVDASVPSFRGRVATGSNVITNGLGNTDTSPGSANNTGTTTGTGTTTTGTATGATAVTPLNSDGHGTPEAGVIAQFVPQATLEPVNIFYPFLSFSSTTTSTTTGTGGTTGTTFTANSNGLTTTNAVYQGFDYVARHPYVNDPIRPNKTDRVIAAMFGFGTTETFDSEGSAFRRYPQIVIAFKNQLKKYRSLGIAPIIPAGQFGARSSRVSASLVQPAPGRMGTRRVAAPTTSATRRAVTSMGWHFRPSSTRSSR